MARYTGFYSMSDKFKLIKDIEANRVSKIQNALKKMEDYLISKEVAQPMKDIKKMGRIEIKGTDINGKERLLQKEIREKFGIDILEDSEGYNTIFPVFPDGVIMCKTENLGNYYTQFSVVEQTEDSFDLELFEYRFYNDTFYLDYMIYIKGLSKKLPNCETETRYSNVADFFLNYYSRNDLRDFSNDELDTIRELLPSPHSAEEQVDIITRYVFDTFRVVNFLKEYYSENENKYDGKTLLYNNEYFAIKNWENDGENIETSLEKSAIINESYIDGILNCRNTFKIIERNTIGTVIQSIVENAQVSTLYTAVGFAFDSGLNLLDKAFEAVHNRNGKCELVIGALQNCDNERANNKIDKTTVKHINELLRNRRICLYTYRPSFYHGKFYYLSNANKAFIIIGSSNVSKTAFNSNYEMDVIHIVDKGSEQDKQFENWYYSLREQCDKIDMLDEKNYEEYNWTSELDAYQALKNRKISREMITQRIEQLSDEDTKFRLNLWNNHNPTDVYEDIDIDALKDYIMFVFAENRLVVFESFIPGNAYYVFRYRSNLVELVDEISRMTKTQMSCSVHYVNRGYHVQYRDKLVKRINRFFYIN